MIPLGKEDVLPVFLGASPAALGLAAEFAGAFGMRSHLFGGPALPGTVGHDVPPRMTETALLDFVRVPRPGRCLLLPATAAGAEWLAARRETLAPFCLFGDNGRLALAAPPPEQVTGRACLCHRQESGACTAVPVQVLLARAGQVLLAQTVQDASLAAACGALLEKAGYAGFCTLFFRDGEVYGLPYPAEGGRLLAALGLSVARALLTERVCYTPGETRAEWRPLWYSALREREWPMAWQAECFRRRRQGDVVFLRTPSRRCPLAAFWDCVERPEGLRTEDGA